MMANATPADALRWHMASVTDNLVPLKGVGFGPYAGDLGTRVAAPEIDHRCQQIARDDSQKLPHGIFEPARTLASRGLATKRYARATAIWLRVLQGKDEVGNNLPRNDPLSDALGSVVAHAGGDAAALFEAIRVLLGAAAQRLGSVPGWHQTVAEQLEAIHRTGLGSILVRVTRREPYRKATVVALPSGNQKGALVGWKGTTNIASGICDPFNDTSRKCRSRGHQLTSSGKRGWNPPYP